MPLDEEVENLAVKIANDNISSAIDLTKQAIDVLILQIKKSSDSSFIQDIEDTFKLLLNAQPSMAPLLHGMGVIMNEISKFYNKIPLDELKEKVIKKGKEFIKKSNIAIKKIVELSSKIIKENDIILTHSMSRTVLEIIQNNINKNLRIFVTESRPQLEGLELAKRIGNIFPVTLIIDSAIGYIIKKYKIDLILVGADSILADGSIINKIGTYPLALVAQDNNIPFYIATESFKFNLRSYYSSDVIIEEKLPNEILSEEIPGVEPKNFYFDITPANLISYIISELGIFPPKQLVQQIIKKVPVNWFKKYLI